jgi:hypothetical protein
MRTDDDACTLAVYVCPFQLLVFSRDGAKRHLIVSNGHQPDQERMHPCRYHLRHALFKEHSLLVHSPLSPEVDGALC